MVRGLQRVEIPKHGFSEWIVSLNWTRLRAEFHALRDCAVMVPFSLVSEPRRCARVCRKFALFLVPVRSLPDLAAG